MDRPIPGGGKYGRKKEARVAGAERSRADPQGKSMERRGFVIGYTRPTERITGDRLKPTLVNELEWGNQV